MNASFECYICKCLFPDEEGLNAHLLIIHNKWRGYCKNPKSPHRETEVSKIIRDLKLDYGVRKKDHKITTTTIRQLMRLKEIGYDIPEFMKQDKAELEHEINYSHEKLTPFRNYSEEGEKTLQMIMDREMKDEIFIKKMRAKHAKKEQDVVLTEDEERKIIENAKPVEMEIIDADKRKYTRCGHERRTHNRHGKYKDEYNNLQSSDGMCEHCECWWFEVHKRKRPAESVESYSKCKKRDEDFRRERTIQGSTGWSISFL